AEIHLRRVQGVEHDVRVPYEPPPLRRETDPAPRTLEQPDARLALQRGQLLGDGGGGHAADVAHGRHRAVLGELAQQAQPGGIQHQAHLTNQLMNTKWTLPIRPRETVARPSGVKPWPLRNECEETSMLTVVEIPQWQGSSSPTAPRLVEGAAKLAAMVP